MSGYQEEDIYNGFYMLDGKNRIKMFSGQVKERSIIKKITYSIDIFQQIHRLSVLGENFLLSYNLVKVLNIFTNTTNLSYTNIHYVSGHNDQAGFTHFFPVQTQLCAVM